LLVPGQSAVLFEGSIADVADVFTITVNVRLLVQLQVVLAPEDFVANGAGGFEHVRRLIVDVQVAGGGELDVAYLAQR